ncbi:MAG TPA: efflux RND transporter periplasmic adaptor subunit [Paludibacteraceae bacterium]|nr:efflux RND transporter periplasmic adaptor subunit [Paludibacteraceae bacterium]HQB68807.1 efflux RND transporter periplasmic adaptor subunit [Paludibacteraceae bacterium]HRS67408.1 efflux RND transporter periplasmic adaptor subunit [Paludibacteraceae bacterium]
MKKAIRIILLSLLGIVVVGTLVFLWQKSQPKTVVYEIVKPSILTISKKTVATGKIEPRNEVAIKPQISGIIAQIYKEAGQRVQAGEIIALVKVIPEMSQLNSAESRVNIAKIDLERTQKQYERDEKLYNSQVLSREEFEQSKANYLKAKEELQNAFDNVEIIKDGIAKRSGAYSNTQIRSTITGVILDIPVKVGNSVIQSNNFNDGTTIATIADMNDMIFKGKIDETEVGRIHEGMPIVLTVGALQDKKFNATLEYISPKGVEENGAVMFEMKAAARIPDSVVIRAGYSANAEIILDQRTDVLTIPESAVSFENDSAFVYVLKSTKDNTQSFDKKFVELGLSDGINIQIIKGVVDSMKIRGLQKVSTDKIPTPPAK